jgi:hypothetical protein
MRFHVGGHSGRAAAPPFNSEATCRTAQALTAEDRDPVQACMRDEADAERQLQAGWSNGVVAHRQPGLAGRRATSTCSPACRCTKAPPRRAAAAPQATVTASHVSGGGTGHRWVLELRVHRRRTEDPLLPLRGPHRLATVAGLRLVGGADQALSGCKLNYFRANRVCL